MPEIMDLISKENVHSLHDAFVEGILELPRTKAGDVGLTQITFDAVGVPIVSYVYTRLLASADKNTTGTLGTYPYVTNKSIHSILHDEGVFHSQKKTSVRLASDITRILSMSGIGHYVRAGHTWYLRPWDEEKVEYFSSYEKKIMLVDASVEKRIDEEADKEVKSSYDLRTFKAPEGSDPKEYIEFLTRFIPAALAIQTERNEALLQIQMLEADLQQASEAEAKAKLSGEWVSVGDQIKELLA
jgi:hypothetical protein